MEHNIYMNRCFELARLGSGYVAPNPMVGAVLVYNGRIIGEGYHAMYGQAHAEVNCIASVAEEDKVFISRSTLYVSLEPCAHQGKTPPCADLVIANKIPVVVIGCKDPFARVNGLGIKKLKDAGIEVIEHVQEEQAIDLNKRFFCFHQNKRPFIILKWAQTADGFIAKENYKAVAISNEYTKKWVHKLRAEEAAIMVGTNTALHDNPSLTVREWKGNNPVRITIDKKLAIPAGAAINSNSSAVIILNEIKDEQAGNISYIKIHAGKSLVLQLMEILYQRNIQSLIVEGGTKLLQSFMDENLWDECFCIINTSMYLQKGVKAPEIPSTALPLQQWNLGNDSITQYKNPQT